MNTLDHKVLDEQILFWLTFIKKRGYYTNMMQRHLSIHDARQLVTWRSG